MKPFTDNPARQVADWGERRLIERIRDWLGPELVPAPPAGIGDDCAVLRARSQRLHGLVTVDPVVYMRHFDDACPAPRAGAKLVNRNLSDLAAMGGWPKWAVLSLILAPQTSKNYIHGFIRGLRSAALPWKLRLIGGDVSASAGSEFIATLTAYGEATRPVARARARAGMRLWLSGRLGGAILGHGLKFKPRLAEGRWLAEHGAAASMIDLTDGLAKDLPALLAAGHHARIDLANIPLAPAARKLAARSGRSPLWHALNDGEDYELLWATPAGMEVNKFKGKWNRKFPGVPVHCIGHVAKGSLSGLPILDINGDKLSIGAGEGFSHF